MRNETAVLLLTCDKYIKVAELTLGLLRFNWQHSPPVFVSGVNRDIQDETVIPFTADPRDWMGIAHQAVSYLKSKGYKYCYLILDDHPPVAKCNSHYLVKELPALADKLNATFVSMVGWDQLRLCKGKKLGKKNHLWLRNDTTYRWIFNLHPACWNISGLIQILEAVTSEDELNNSARAFEARAGSLDYPVGEKLQKSSYRVCGDKYSLEHRWFSRPHYRKLILPVFHVVRFSANLMGGKSFLNKVDVKAKIYTDYLNGPYPMFWSGLMQKGKLHENAVRFLQLAGLSDFADQAKDIKLDF